MNQATKTKMREARPLYGSTFAAADDLDNTPKCTKEVPATLDIHWVLGTSLCVWFLWIYAPRLLAAKDYIPSLLYIHLFGVYFIYMACVHNTLLTPSTFGGAARPFHIAIGRLGLILGIVGFVSGFILTWLSDETYDIGFSVGITIGGFSQIFAQYNGYMAIQKYKSIKAQIETSHFNDQRKRFELEDEQDKHLILHIGNMIGLFILACGIPALIRIADSFGPVSLFFFIPFTYYLAGSMTIAFKKKVENKRLTERNLIPNNVIEQ